MRALYPLIAVFAAMLSGCGFVLQQHAAQQVRDTRFLNLRLITRLAQNRRWLAGIAIMILGYLTQAWILGHLDLTVVEPLITTSLIFALILAVPLSGQVLRKAEVIGAVLLTAGVGALSLTRSVRAPSESFGSFSHWPAAAGIALIAAFAVQLGRKRSGRARATLTGLAAGLILGTADAFTRRSVQLIDGRHPLDLLMHWPGYATVVTTIVGLWLMQNAFSAGPLQASLPAITAAEPAAGIVLGVVVYGDVVHVTPLLVAVQIAGILAMVSGVILVARAKVFAELRLRELPHAALEALQRLEDRDPPGPGEPPEPGSGEAGARQEPPPGPPDGHSHPAGPGHAAFLAGRRARPGSD